MSGMGTSLRQYLLLDGPVYTLVQERIHQGIMPQVSKYPAIWFEQRGKESIISLNGDRTGLARYTFDVECLARTGEQAAELADAVEAILSGYKGTFGGTRSIQASIVESVDDEYVPQADASDSGVSITAMSVTIVST